MEYKNKKAAIGGLRPWIISLIMVILGSFCFVAFAFNLIGQTNPSSDIFDQKYHLNDSVSSMQNSLDSFSKATSEAQQILLDSKPSPLDYIFLIFLGAFYIPWNFLTFSVSGINSVAVLIFNFTLGAVGGLPGATPTVNILAVVSGVIMSGLLITVIFFIIKAIRSGDSG